MTDINASVLTSELIQWKVWRERFGIIIEPIVTTEPARYSSIIIVTLYSAVPTFIAHSAVHNIFENRSVFGITLKVAVVVDVNVRCCGSAFHRHGAATLKALSTQ